MLRHAIAPARFFSQVPNEIIRHPRLSAEAVRLLTWQLSLPDGANEPLSETAKQAGIRKTAFIRAKRELIAEGYVHEWRRQGPNGRWTTTQLVTNTPLSADDAMALRDGHGLVARPTVGKPAVGEPKSRSVGRHPKNTEEKTYNPPSQPSHLAVPPALVDRGGLIVAAVSHRDRRLRFTGRDVQHLAPLAGEWLLRGATVQEIREALTDGLPDRVHSPAALARNRLIRKMPDAPPFPARATPAPQPLRACDGGCDRVFRPVGDETRCRDCRQAAAEEAESVTRGRDGAAVRTIRPASVPVSAF
ncbi:hypothetical protein [Streptomyces sp. NPDC046261]|uniref:hypothetical protein n=1 Tax=Streptomyces sp. NPDC046261 TaxID=3157200 RepID=UPI0033C5C277